MGSKELLGLQKLIDAGLIVRGSERPPVELLSTGIKALDELLGGGIPIGQCTEVYGHEGCGKSTLFYHVLAAAGLDKRFPDVNIGLVRRKTGKPKSVYAALLDTEGSYLKERAQVVGVDTTRIAHMLPDYGEQALDGIFDMSSAGLRLVTIDSASALMPATMVDGDSAKKGYGGNAGMLTSFFNRYVLRKDRPTLVCSSQVRDKIGFMGYGDPLTTPGGHAFKHYAYLRLQFRRRMALKKGDRVIGQEVAVKIMKSKYCAPYRDTTLFLLYDRGYVGADEWESVKSRKGVKVAEPLDE